MSQLQQIWAHDERLSPTKEDSSSKLCKSGSWHYHDVLYLSQGLSTIEIVEFGIKTFVAATTWLVLNHCWLKLTEVWSAMSKWGTGNLMDSIGKGTLVMETKRGARYTSEVMIVPGLDGNLLSVGQMVEHGYWLLFEHFMVFIFGGRNLQYHIATIQKKGNRCFSLHLNMWIL